MKHLHPKFKGPYKPKTVDVVKLNCIDLTTVFSIKVPMATRYEVSFGPRTVTSTGAASAAGAGDDATIDVSIDGGVSWFSPGSVAGTAVVIGADDAGVVTITESITHVRAANALLGADETQVINIACVSE